MSNYVQSTNFATKDALPSGDPLKIVKGTEINTEFNNIAVAVATKADLNSPTFTGTVTAPAFVGPLTGNVTGNVTGALTGNATTATTATTAGNVTGVVAIANGGTGATTAGNAFTAIKQAATVVTTGVVELATDAETQAGTDTTRAVTPANLQASIFGKGQTYQSLTGSRSIGTPYTNNTAKPIVVAVTCGVATGNLIVMTIGGIALSAGTSPAAASTSGGMFIVPAGATYVLSGVTSITSWVEFR